MLRKYFSFEMKFYGVNDESIIGEDKVIGCKQLWILKFRRLSMDMCDFITTLYKKSVKNHINVLIAANEVRKI